MSIGLRAVVLFVLVCASAACARADEFQYGFGSTDIASTGGRFGFSGSAGSYTLDYFQGTFAGVRYDASSVGLGNQSGQVYIGGLLNGVGGLSGYTNDFLDLSQFTPGTSTAVNPFLYATTTTDVQRGSVTLTLLGTAPTVAVTPEPSSLLLLGTGVLGMVTALRRRFV